MHSGRIWLDTVITLVGFNLLHVPIWGWGFALEGLVSGAVALAFLIWRKDLLTTMVFHISTDAIGIVIAPMFTEWWKKPTLF